MIQGDSQLTQTAVSTSTSPDRGDGPNRNSGRSAACSHAWSCARTTESPRVCRRLSNL